MKKIIAGSMLAAMLVSTPFMFSQVNAISADKDSDRGWISVSYTAEKEVTPDTVEISIAVKTDDKRSMQEAVRKNKEISDKVYAYVKTFINPENKDYVKTSNFSAYPEYQYNSGKRYLDKYSVSNNIIVHTKYVDKISTLIDKSLGLGATNVDSLNFSLSEKDKECAELLKTAATNARKRADLVAAASGSVVTGIRNIDTSCSVNRAGNYNFARNTLMMAKSAGAMEDAVEPESSPNIEAGVIRVYSNVNASYYLK